MRTLPVTDRTYSWPTNVVNQAEDFLFALERVTQHWRDGELSDEEFRSAKKVLLELGSAPESFVWPPDDVSLPRD